MEPAFSVLDTDSLPWDVYDHVERRWPIHIQSAALDTTQKFRHSVSGTVSRTSHHWYLLETKEYYGMYSRFKEKTIGICNKVQKSRQVRQSVFIEGVVTTESSAGVSGNHHGPIYAPGRRIGPSTELLTLTQPYETVSWRIPDGRPEQTLTLLNLWAKATISLLASLGSSKKEAWPTFFQSLNAKLPKYCCM